MYRGLHTLSLPTLFDAERIVDQALRNHPISVLRETGLLERIHQGADALWAAHMDQMQQRRSRQKRNLLIFAYRAWTRLDCAISRCCLQPWVFCLDPFHAWLTWRFHQPLPCKCQMPLLGGVGHAALYTGLPQLYLNDLTDRDELELLAGSRILIHFYGAVGDHILTETVSRHIQDVPPATDQKQEFTIAQAGEIAISGQNAQLWSVTLRADDRPTVTLDQAFETDFFGVSKLGYWVTDDYG